MVYLDGTFRAPAFDFDFTKITDDGINFKRGGFVYKRPIGTMRLALNVLDRYGDNSWLGVVGRNSAKVMLLTSGLVMGWFFDNFILELIFTDIFAVSYHGTVKHNLESIAEHGYLLTKGKRFLFGRGIYTTPNMEVAMLYTETYTYGNEKYKFIIQNRVNPNNLKQVSDSITGLGEYWISEKQEDVRPYGICVKKC